ncbi:piggyBac transposable element-derived protein 3-like isoform X2 [Phlebotomus papatasi]|uniref:piggyBac transposable element-derived protein 3-like isoform X2 n=1 Tax=Phlebotomus papatasi TaxID=29031 RepID=UPI002483FCAF|nr:piggyBac transposable element-derived protein 3-like isoform X2 [Phlebotomus papatasi]
MDVKTEKMDFIDAVVKEEYEIEEMPEEAESREWETLDANALPAEAIKAEPEEPEDVKNVMLLDTKPQGLDCVSDLEQNGTHQCGICGRSFKNRYTLKSHMVKHQKKKGFPCPYCTRVILQKKRLMHHVKTNHECSVCGAMFRMNIERTTHIQQVHYGSSSRYSDVEDFYYWLLSQGESAEDDIPSADAEALRSASHFQVVLLPPDDGMDSDKNTDDSDEEGNFGQLDRGLFKQNGELLIATDQGKMQIQPDKPNDPMEDCGYDQGNTSKVWSRKELHREWQNSSITKETPNIVKEMMEKDTTPLEVFKMIFDSEIVDKICHETGKSARQSGDLAFTVSREEMYHYFGILLVSGYVKVPAHKMYFETQEDTLNLLVSGAMSRCKFEKIHRHLHFNDNKKIDKEDKLHKVRPLVDHLNKKFPELREPFGKDFTIDEAIEPYYGTNSMKQFINGKPIYYGFRFWCLTTSDGYLLRFDPYQGRSHRFKDASFETMVAMQLVKDIVPEHSTIYMNNFFSSFELAEVLNKKNINVVGSIRDNRLKDAPLKDLKNDPPGTYDVLQDDEGMTLIRWKEHSQVTLMSNLQTSDTLSLIKWNRYSPKDKRKVPVLQPMLVKMYNRGIKGVEIFDRQREEYRITMKATRWHFPIFRFCLNAAVVNAWQIYRFKDSKVTLLQFIRSITSGILITGNPIKHSLYIPKTMTSKEIRHDGAGHIVKFIDKPRRCKLCGKCAKFVCIKCNVGLHPKDCFLNYHTQ